MNSRSCLLLVSLVAWITVSGLKAEDKKPAGKIKVVLYDDAGSAGKGVPSVNDQLTKEGSFEVLKLNAEQLRTVDWSDAKAVIFTGGSGSKQSKTIGPEGVKKVQEFVQKGGGYVGICAGAYLACEGFTWGLKVLDAKTASNKWQRGVGDVKIEFTDKGQQILGFTAKEQRDIRYANGPIYRPANVEAIPDFEPLAFFRTELAEHDSPKGAMVNSAAMVAAPFGKGRVLCSSPHPEQTAGMENWVPKAVHWVAGQ